MVFESHPKCTVAIAALLLSGAALMAGLTYPVTGRLSAAALVSCATVFILALLLLSRGLAALVRVSYVPPLEVPVGVPQDHALLSARLLALEAQLEYAPIALFRIDPSHQQNAVESLNGSARRLLAPGRATDIADLHGKLGILATGRRSIIEFGTERGAERALAMATSLTMGGKPQRLVALMPMENELEAEAMQAWQRLVHVLTHEIMNSLTPVASLSQTSRELLAGLRANLPDDVAEDLDVALDAIKRRAESLTHFVGNYRALASVPAAQPQPIVLNTLFARLSALIAPAWQIRGGRAAFLVEAGSLELKVDSGQLEQALINLLKNAAEATSGLAAPEVMVTAKLTRGGRLRIEVRDNGPGVEDDVIAHIFTPFFSTKNKGNGIGLAMVRQLAHRNGGTVRYAKSIGPGARFIIAF
jgi:signal transduction histidine kinase